MPLYAIGDGMGCSGMGVSFDGAYYKASRNAAREQQKRSLKKR